ncbi:protein phosphatase 2C domain-containing protein [Microcoleus sp.]
MTKFNLVVNIEVAEDKGEDDNLAEHFGQSFLMGVFDGLGGASAGYDGKTGGRIASAEASQITKEFFKQRYGEIAPENVIELQNKICQSLKHKADNNMQKSRLKGTLLQHRLCTTIALASIPKQQGQEKIKIFEVDVAWMGDSRIYFLSPTKGLQQLTKDDLKTSKDALEMLRQDPPMSQCLTADISPESQIHFQHYKIEETAGCFLACTDGCFQYFSAPWEFEKLLLEMLSKSEGDTMEKNTWQQLIKQRYTEIKQDDVSLILYPVGFNGIKHLKSSYQKRLQYLQENFMAPTANSRYEDVQNLWEKYRIDYEYYFQFIQEIQLIATSKLPVSEDYSSSSVTSVTSSLSTQELNQVFKQKAAAKAEEIQTLLEQAYSYYENNRLNEAQNLCSQILNIEVHNTEAKYLLGLIYTKSAFTESNYYNRGELFKKAASYFEELVLNKSAVEKLIAVEKIVESYRILGFIYYSLNSPNKSVDYYQIFFKSEGSDKLDNWQEHLNFFVISLRNSTGNKCESANSAIQFCHRLVHNTKLLPYGRNTVIYYFMAQLQEIEGELNAALNSLQTVLANSLQLDYKMHQEAQQMYHKIMNKLNGRRY